MADNSKILLSGNENGEQIVIDPSVLEVILGIAAEKVDGVVSMRGGLKSGIKQVLGRRDHGKGVRVTSDQEGDLVADVDVLLEAGVNVPETASKLQKVLKKQLLQMTDLNMQQINIHVVGLVFPDEVATEDTTDELFPEAKQD